MEPKSFLRILSILHFSLCAGLLLFTAFAYFHNGKFMANMDKEDIFIYIVPLLAVAGYFASQFLFKKLLSGIEKEDELQAKLVKYQAASLIKYALIEGPAFVALFAYYGNGNALHLVIAIALMVYQFAQKPTATKLTKELPLTLEEQKQFDTLQN